MERSSQLAAIPPNDDDTKLLPMHDATTTKLQELALKNALTVLLLMSTEQRVRLFVIVAVDNAPALKMRMAYYLQTTFWQPTTIRTTPHKPTTANPLLLVIQFFRRPVLGSRAACVSAV